MTWPFEHWDNGKVYLHNDNWNAFYNDVNENGYEGVKHDWNHRRLFLKIQNPRHKISDIWMPGDDPHRIESTVNWGLAYIPFPAFVRTAADPEGWAQSWHIWAEQDLNGIVPAEMETITLLETIDQRIENSDNSKLRLLTGSYYTTIDNCPETLSPFKNHFAFFRDQYWQLTAYNYIGIGNWPPQKASKKKKSIRRNIFDEPHS